MWDGAAMIRKEAFEKLTVAAHERDPSYAGAWRVAMDVAMAIEEPCWAATSLCGCNGTNYEGR